MQHKPYGIYELLLKRPLDFILSLCSVIILSPLIGIIAIMVRIKMGSPIIFIQERPGKNGKIFKLYKFRTMNEMKNSKGELLSDSDRLTTFGRILRSTSLDELPELFNIIKGDMAIVGPRPLLIRYLPAYTEVERHRHDVRPGLSGLAQISGRNYVPWDKRLAYDVEYVNRITFLGDLKIIVKTLVNVIMRENVAENPEEIDEGYLDEIRNMTGRR